ncbi:MAG TPA: prolyl oligopeptidase family serine peptidase [Steroidobacteraceae bacterium]|nr:prolyl oligopeptidase family serine peptidase [Steroidobacteraceae bacterium]
MRRILARLAAVTAVLALAACGGSSTPSSAHDPSTSRGTLVENPPLRIASLDAPTLQADLSASASGAQLLQLTGAPTCGVDFYYLNFWTVGGADEPTESSGALMVPTGSAAACTGPRPIVLYAHGTQTDKAANIADITDPNNTEGALIAATFAAQGYIVVAPNYAGYDISTLGYHPYLDATQQSDEMIDILAAARSALPDTLSSATSDNGKLFVTGYSEGGYVAMATQRALIAAGAKVTAAAPMSGPYALEAFGDAIFFGSVDLGATVFAPLLTTGYQHAYGDIYTATTDVYSPTYASGIDTLLPSTTPLATIFASNLLPQTALFDSTTPTVTIPGNAQLSAQLTAALAVPSNPNNPDTPLFDLGFGSSYLITNAYRVSYALDAAADPDGAVPTPTAGVPLAAVVPTQTLRKAFYLNDLRNGAWAPNSPTLLCGGDQDPTVFFSINTGTMQAFWSATPAAPLISVLDVNAPPAGPFAAVQAAFQQSQAAELAFYESPAGGGNSAAAAGQLLVEGYHAAVAPFCSLAARSFFSQF